MNATDILGSLLGAKKNSGSAGGNILKDIFGGGSPQRQSQPRQAPAPRQGSRPQSIDQAAKSLEDILHVSNDRNEQRHPQSGSTSQGRSTGRETSVPSSSPQRRYSPPAPEEEAALNQQSAVLIRAMVSAAKSDGQMTRDEQQKVLGQVGQLSPSDLDFLKTEFAREADPKDVAWNTPLGMEEQVYSMSLIAIDLDENKEAEYLADLAHGLRLQPRTCNQIHQKYNAPQIFRT